MDAQLIQSIQDYITENRVRGTFLQDDQSKFLIEKLAAIFSFDLQERWLWEQVVFENCDYYDYEGADWDKVMKFLLSDFHDKIYLVVTDDEFYPWKLLECDKASVVHLLNQQQLFEFFIFDDSFDKIIFDTHENLLIKYVNLIKYVK